MIDNFRPIVVINPSPTPPTPTWNLLYNWDFTVSLIDSEQNEPLDVDSGYTRDSDGLSATYFNFPISILEPGYAVELYFGDTSFTYTDSVPQLIYVDGAMDTIGFFTNTSSFSSTPWSLQCGNNYTQVIQGDEDSFANSTLRIEISNTQNNNLIWTIYKNDTLICTTPEYGQDGTTPFFDYSKYDPTDVLTTVCSGWANQGDGRIAAFKIYQKTIS